MRDTFRSWSEVRVEVTYSDIVWGEGGREFNFIIGAQGVVTEVREDRD